MIKTDMDLRMDALRILMPNGHAYSGDETDYELTKPDGSPDKIPTLEEMNSKVAELRKDYEAKQYQRDRQTEYPTVEELVVALYDTDDKADIEAKRAEVKKKYPKP
tara:strand:+ start:398 stop:715 length:318 start_codon:yes stop_codon:yes gene_type:complete